MTLSFTPTPSMAPGPGTNGRLVYAVGDVHGRYDLLKPLLGLLIDDCRKRVPAERAMLVFCGDYVDRGPQSAEVLETLLWLRGRREFEVRLLKGNHEQAFLQFLDTPEQASDWMRYGGAATLASYGVKPPHPEDPAPAYVAARAKLLRQMPTAHQQLLRELELTIVVGDYAFVHAGIRPGVPLKDQSEQDLLWIRQDFLDAPGPFEKVIVHGHTRTPVAHLLEHRLGIDTGAYETGVLTAIRLDEDGVALFDTADEA